LPAAIKAWYVENERFLGAYLKKTTKEERNLGAYLKQTTLSTKDIRFIIKGYKYGVEEDFPGLLRPTIQTQIEFPGYLKQAFTQYLDLQMKIRGQAFEWPIDFPVSMKGWQEVVLGAYLLPKIAVNLGAIIRSTYEINFPAYIYSVPPTDLPVSIMPWHVSTLPALISGVYGDGDLQASIYPVRPKDLAVYIHGYKGIAVPRNLPAYLTSFNTLDLGASIGNIPSVNLYAYLNAIGGYKDLACYIVPKVIHIKRFIEVILLEHKDLTGVINTACFGTGYKNLGSYLLPKHKKDLGGYIFPWTGDNIVNLSAKINTGNVLVEDYMFISIKNTSTGSTASYSIVKPVAVHDTLVFSYGSYSIRTLSAYINGVLNTSYTDLSVSLSPTINISYTSDPYGRGGRETTINIAKGEEQWEREIEMFFSEAASYYFYVHGANEIYKQDRNKRWVLRVEGFEYTTDKRVERGRIRAKYIFNLEKYNSIDAAVIDAIDRVSMFRRYDLGAYVVPTGGFRNLRATLSPAGYKYKSYRAISASITAQP
jgi:hypothetical protein